MQQPLLRDNLEWLTLSNSHSDTQKAGIHLIDEDWLLMVPYVLNLRMLQQEKQ